MQIVIDIPEDKYSLIQCGVANGIGDWLHKIVANGTPLPNHGRLIDADKFISEHFGEVARLVDDTSTIIEADKE